MPDQEQPAAVAVQPDAVNEIAVKESTGVATAPAPRFTPEQIAESNLDTQSTLPDLAKAEKHFVPINIEYWTPEKEGEEKLVYIHSVGNHEIPDMETGEIKVLECVLLLEHIDGVIRRYQQAGRVLVGNIKDAIQRGEIVPGTALTPISIKYLGQKKNKSNSKMSNRWEIIPLVQNVN